MISVFYADNVAFLTEYDDEKNLVQVFRNVSPIKKEGNCPVDFLAAGFQKKVPNNNSMLDSVLAFSTDECPPVHVCGSWIGGNHSAPYTVSVIQNNHGKDFSDIASSWKDDEGTIFTLLKVADNELMFISENLGTREEYEFKREIKGKLTHIGGAFHTEDIDAKNQKKSAIPSMNSYIERVVYIHLNTGETLKNASCGNIKEAEIVEEYNVINPSTVADYIKKNRPSSGYTENISLNVGEPMINRKLKYRVQSDGTVICEFENTVLDGVNFEKNMGIMYQEKSKPEGGTIYRYIPKTKPLKTELGEYDFSSPRDTAGALPCFLITPEFWESADFPPDRQIDFITKADGSVFAAFAGGFLPICDGVPEIRKNNITHSTDLYKTKKTYPIFADGKFIKHSKGVGYRKYFPSDKSSSVYRIEYDGIKYIYVDIFENDSVEIEEKGKKLSAFEKFGNVEIEIFGERAKIKGEKGFAVLKTE